MNILGIETSCDESAASVVRDGGAVLSSVVYSQIPLHERYGGVVPEIASRSHVEVLPGIIERAVQESGLCWQALDGVAVTYGPGLASSLLVGLNAAKALALRLGRALVGVNHLEAHIVSVLLGSEAPRFEQICPLLVLLVSGGHTCLVRIPVLGRYEMLGQTLDDAAGEAFDKGAKLLGLGYPGGPAIQEASVGGDPAFVRFPRGLARGGARRNAKPDREYAFSFSGVKTALLYYLRDHPDAAGRSADLAASYQEAIVESLMRPLERAARRFEAAALAVVGGVSLNARLRERAAQVAARVGLPLVLADKAYCTDNAAMVAGLAGLGLGLRGKDADRLDAVPNLPLT